MASLKKMSLLLSGRVGQIVYDSSNRSLSKDDAKTLKVWSFVVVFPFLLSLVFRFGMCHVKVKARLLRLLRPIGSTCVCLDIQGG